MNYYAIGDIHGRLDLLQRAHAVILKSIANSPSERAAIVHLGDYIDRGAQGIGVLHYLADFAPAGVEIRNLIGNHEQFCRLALDLEAGVDPHGAEYVFGLWQRNGGAALLKEIAADQDAAIAENQATLRNAIGAKSMAWLRGLSTHWRPETDLLFVHAGISPNLSIDEAMAEPWHDTFNPDHWAWIRNNFLYRDFARVHPSQRNVAIVHGHSIKELLLDELPAQIDNRLNLDAGAYKFGKMPIVKFTPTGAIACFVRLDSGAFHVSPWIKIEDPRPRLRPDAEISSTPSP